MFEMYHLPHVPSKFKMLQVTESGMRTLQVELRGRMGLEGASAERWEGKRTSGSIDNH